MAEAFIGNIEGLEINHIDGDKLNNHYKNLEWMTPSENTQHSNDAGLRKPTHSHEETKFPIEGEVIHDWQEYGNSDLSDDDATVKHSMF